MKIISSVLSLSFLYSLSAVAQVAPAADVSIQSRYLQIANTKNLLQDNITIRASVDFNGHFEIHSLLQTGDTYSSGFNTAYNLKTDKASATSDIIQMHLKQIYLKKYFNQKKSEVNIGVIAPESQFDSTLSTSAIGWVDGMRFKHTSDIGEINYTIGQLQPLSPDINKRFDHFKVNFVEISLKKAVFEKLLIQARLQSLNNNQFASVSVNTELAQVLSKIIKTTADLQYDIANNSYRYSVGVRDLINTLSEKKSDINVSLDYEYISQNFSKDMQLINSSMNSSFTGHALVVKTMLPVSKKANLNFFTNIRFGADVSQLRIESGLSKSIFKTKKK